MKKNWLSNRLAAVLTAVVLMLSICAAAFAESYSAGIMRLLNYEGEVYILDESGQTRFLMENARFKNGESLNTGEGAMASVGLDDTKILTLDAMTQVDFVQENNRMTLKLASGRLLLDVQQKLDENESLDIETSTMTVGIRGTVVYLTSYEGSAEDLNQALFESNETFKELLLKNIPEDFSGNFTQLVVLEGKTLVTYRNSQGRTVEVEVNAGEKLTVVDADNDRNADDANVEEATRDDLGEDTVNRIENDPDLLDKVNRASDILDPKDDTQQNTGRPTNTPAPTDTPAPTATPTPTATATPTGTPTATPEHAHTPVAIPAVAATCTETGLTEGSKCSVCGEILTAQETVPALGHDWDAGTETTPATCTEAGVKTYACSRCDVTRIEPISALGHSWNDGEVTTPAGCETEGIKTFICSRCDETRTEAIAALGHSWNAGEVTTPAECESAGVKTFTCTRCDTTRTETIPALGHAWDETGNIPATCTEAGSKSYACSRCDATRTDTIPALGHQPVPMTEMKPTCTEDGYSGGSKCSVCGEVLTAQVVEPALGGSHDYQNFGEPYYVTIGDLQVPCQTKKCSRCGDIIEVVVE